MTRFTFAATSAAFLVTIAGCGGGDGGGGKPETPFLTSVSPEVGSANTIWTLTGTDFAETASDNTVYFDGAEAVVIGVGTGDDPVLMVKTTNLDITASQVVDVTVARGSRRSNPIAVGLVPSGSIEFVEELPVWKSPETIALDGDLLYVQDETGVFENDLATGEIRTIARANRGGLLIPSGVFLTDDGQMWISDTDSTGSAYRLFRWTSGSLDLIGFPFLSRIVAVTRDAATGNVYVVSETDATRFDADGIQDTGFNPGAFASAAAGAVFQTAKLLVTFPGVGLISQIDPTTGVHSDFINTLSSPGPLVGDGSNLFTNDGSDLVTVSSAAVSSPFFDSTTGDVSVDIGAEAILARRSTGELLVGSPDFGQVVSIASGAVASKMVTAGSRMQITLTTLPSGELLVTDNNSNCAPQTDGDATGVLTEIRRDGTARTLTNEMCLIGGTTIVGDELYGTAFTGTTTTVKKLDLTTGEVTAVATSADGFAFAISAASDAAGNVYIGALDGSTSEGRIHRIAPDGTITLDLGTTPGLLPASMIVSGDQLLISGGSLGGGLASGPLLEMPLSGGPAVETGIELGSAFDGFAPDGAGGIYANAFLQSGGLVHVAADWTTRELVSVPSLDEKILGVERDVVTGAIWVSLFDVDEQRSRLAIVYP